MAKLKVELDIEFSTSALIVVDNDFQEKLLNSSEAVDLLSRVPLDELRFEVISTNDDAGMSIEFSGKDGAKNSVFEIRASVDGPGLQVKVVGQFSRPLRKGADSMLKDLGSDLDLRLRAITWRGGYYNGFSAPLSGGDFSQSSPNWRETFPKVELFSVF